MYLTHIVINSMLVCFALLLQEKGYIIGAETGLQKSINKKGDEVKTQHLLYGGEYRSRTDDLLHAMQAL
jgi:hypothetical protein